jgi:bifunctional non-homologous end joining protein LigD
MSPNKSHQLPLIQPMLASLATAPFTREGWVFEPKLDGIRAIAYIRHGDVKLLSRRGNELSGRYPVLESALSDYAADIILDGEIVALDTQGRPSFQLLQQRSGLTLDAEVSQAEQDIPIQYYVFDILYLNGPLLDRTLEERKQILRKNLLGTDTTKFVGFLGSSGEDAFRASLDAGLEGVIAKRLTSIYEPGKRTKSWLKIKATRTAEFVICGYTPGTGSREQTFGALVLAYYDRAGNLSYAGLVGTGFTDTKQKKLLQLFGPLETTRYPFTTREASRLKASWLQPKLVAEVKYAEFTKDGKLRAPVFITLRDDITPQQTGPNPIVDTNLRKSKLTK